MKSSQINLSVHPPFRTIIIIIKYISTLYKRVGKRMKKHAHKIFTPLSREKGNLVLEYEI